MKVQNDLNLISDLYALVEAVSVGFQVDVETSKILILKALHDKRLNILEIISELHTLDL